MPINVTPTLRRALHQLETQRAHIERQITALRGALDGLGGPKGREGRSRLSGPTRQRRRMSATVKRAISQRMKAYWAKRKASRAKGK
jgi:hypothetical protein